MLQIVIIGLIDNRTKSGFYINKNTIDWSVMFVMMSKLSANIKMKRKPQNGSEAYLLLVESLEIEIKEKQDILSELTSEEVKQKFIRNWNSKTKSVTIKN